MSSGRGGEGVEREREGVERRMMMTKENRTTQMKFSVLCVASQHVGHTCQKRKGDGTENGKKRKNVNKIKRKGTKGENC